jgi:hypothetical protein
VISIRFAIYSLPPATKHGNKRGQFSAAVFAIMSIIVIDIIMNRRKSSTIQKALLTKYELMTCNRRSQCEF